MASIILSASGHPDVIEAAATLREATNMRRYADNEADSAKVKLEAFIALADAEDFPSVQINAGKNTVRVTQYERVTVDTQALKRDYPEIVQAYTHCVLCKRFTVSDV